MNDAMSSVPSSACCVPGCREAVDAASLTVGPPLCAAHWADVSAATKARSTQTARRLAWLRERWNDTAYFDAVERSGRYLKFSSALAQAFDAAALAWQRVRTEAALAALRKLVDAESAPRLAPAGSRRRKA